MRTQHMHFSQTESAAVTYTNGKKTVPNTANAVKVILQRVKVHFSEPEKIDGLTAVKGTIMLGDKTSRTSISTGGTNGNVLYFHEFRNSDGADEIFRGSRGYDVNIAPEEIPKDDDGNYYLTAEVEGVGNAAAKGIYGHAVILIIEAPDVAKISGASVSGALGGLF